MLYFSHYVVLVKYRSASFTSHHSPSYLSIELRNRRGKTAIRRAKACVHRCVSFANLIEATSSNGGVGLEGYLSRVGWMLPYRVVGVFFSRMTEGRGMKG